LIDSQESDHAPFTVDGTVSVQRGHRDASRQ